MKNYIHKHQIELQILTTTLFLVSVGIFSYVTSSIFSEIKVMNALTASSTAKFNESIINIQSDLAIMRKTDDNLTQSLSSQLSKSQSVEQQINGISSTVNNLEKLSKTDRELLQKYSKIYFLNENYVPLHLSIIDSKYYQDKTKQLQFHGTVLPFLTKMLDDAYLASSDLQIVSAYRSFGTQSSLKSNYLVQYGSGANKFSADQGYSEHQLGTTIDLTAPNFGAVLAINFDETPAYVWLHNNAYKYGFILSYPKGNTYYQYEPWHWRFVGIKLATYLHNQSKNFYDLDQREIDTYLINIFDQIN